MRHQALDGLLDDVLALAVAEFHVLGNARGKLDELVIQKGHAAFNTGGHAHLVLLHEQFDQVGLLVGEEKTGKGRESRFGIPVLAEVGVGRNGRQIAGTRRAVRRRKRRNRSCPGIGIPDLRRGRRRCAGVCGEEWKREAEWSRPGCEWRCGRRGAGGRRARSQRWFMA